MIVLALSSELLPDLGDASSWRGTEVEYHRLPRVTRHSSHLRVVVDDHGAPTLLIRI